MRGFKIGSAVALMVLLGASTVVAGYKYNKTVYVRLNADGSGRASGTLGAARNSADGNQEVSCSLYSDGTALCYAYDANNVFISCMSTDTAIFNAVAGVGTDSYVSFGVNTAGRCTSVWVENCSGYEPKIL
jgi:hypothetical protein